VSYLAILKAKLSEIIQAVASAWPLRLLCKTVTSATGIFTMIKPFGNVNFPSVISSKIIVVSLHLFLFYLFQLLPFGFNNLQRNRRNNKLVLLFKSGYIYPIPYSKHEYAILFLE